jgi:hypothetical protein
MRLETSLVQLLQMPGQVLDLLVLPQLVSEITLLGFFGLQHGTRQ